ncbi:hypothetical protein CDAR_472531 [Caerostris darwini]|uniref:Uncharacterized protein n=1 Tax=Caerostris darwini TaxID=1538125 RepID=A0AAV4NW42_9ARAC|nr:hypothetical protein CDAR_472531 [Caerostris darwini]
MRFHLGKKGPKINGSKISEQRKRRYYVQAFCSHRKQPTLLQSHYRDGLLGDSPLGDRLLGDRIDFYGISGYLVIAHTLHLSVLQLQETTHLITEPLQGWTSRSTGSKSETESRENRRDSTWERKAPRSMGTKLEKEGNNVITSKRVAVTGNNPPYYRGITGMDV